MTYTPKWRMKIRPSPHPPGTPQLQSEEFKAKRALYGFDKLTPERQCTTIAYSTGRRCRMIRMMGSEHCKHHRGQFKALEEEQRRHPKFTIIADRSKAKRKKALAELGIGPWPDGLPHRPDLDVLGPVARGRLFEAWFNREMAPDVWRHEWERERIRIPPRV